MHSDTTYCQGDRGDGGEGTHKLMADYVSLLHAWHEPRIHVEVRATDRSASNSENRVILQTKPL